MLRVNSTLAFDECLMTHPPSKSDEGYGLGVSIDSMIVNPHVLVLVKDTTNGGTSEEPRGNDEQPAQPMDFDPNVPFRLG